jgi:hypothetical protein
MTTAMLEEQDVVVLSRRSDCRCPACKIGRFEDAKLHDVLIEDYSFDPGWTPRKTSADRYDYFLGVELETDDYRMVGLFGEQRQSSIPVMQAADMAEPKSFWVPKHDGSVTGPEFASHPATLDYWHAKRRELSKMFRSLLHAGYRSHDNDTCGMHVNISRGAFDDSDHLFRFLTLIHVNPTWTLRMSQRTLDSAGQWASLHQMADPQIRRKCVEWDRSYEEFGLDRYVALNGPGGGRYEFRLPRGTLRLDRFYKNLEWTAGMIEYTREHRLRESNPLRFMAWVRSQQDHDLKNLIRFLDERMTGEYTGEVYPKPARKKLQPVELRLREDEFDDDDPPACDAMHPSLALRCTEYEDHGGRHEAWDGDQYQAWSDPRIFCNQVSPRGYYCTEPEGHGGMHRAGFFDAWDADTACQWVDPNTAEACTAPLESTIHCSCESNMLSHHTFQAAS